MITHARTQAAAFLGYEITVQHSATRPAVNGSIALVSPRLIKAKCAPYLKRGKPARRTGLMNQDDHVIISPYGAEYRGCRVLPAGRRRLETEPAAMGHADLAAQDAGRQASLVGGEDGPQIRGHHRHAARTAAVL